jgi:hemoglobin-like flavoprotein
VVSGKYITHIPEYFNYVNVVIFAHYKTLFCTFSAVETQTYQQPDETNAAIASYADNVTKYINQSINHIFISHVYNNK